jgi:hypothetical protein
MSYEQENNHMGGYGNGRVPADLSNIFIIIVLMVFTLGIYLIEQGDNWWPALRKLL